MFNQNPKPQCVDFIIIVNRGKYQVIKPAISKETKMPRVMVEGPRQRTIFCFALAHTLW